MMVAALILVAATTSAPAETLTPGQMRSLGFELLAAGETGRALAVAAALLERDPQDSTALALRARALRDQGQNRAARSAARTAWAAAETRREQFDAALVQAQTLASAGNRTAAQFWLRRAVQIAPSPAERAVAERDFRYVRNRNPLHLSFSFGAAPSSNVNNGSQHQTIPGFGFVGTLSPDAQALSGWAAQMALGARLRLGETAQGNTWARINAARREVRLSAASKARLDTWESANAADIAAGLIAPARRNFNFGAVEAGIGHRHRSGPTSFSAEATLGHNWYGGENLSDYLRANLGAEHLLNPRLAVHGGLTLERQWRRDNAWRNADQVTVELGMVRVLANGDRLRFGLGARQVDSFSPDIRHDATMARLGWDKALPVAGIGIAANLAVEHRRYDPSFLAPAGRRDLRLDAALTLTFETVGYMGFVPTLDIHATRFRSNAKLFDGRDAGIALGIRSQF